MVLYVTWKAATSASLNQSALSLLYCSFGNLDTKKVSALSVDLTAQQSLGKRSD